jgi:radical SAM/Cys-rich protein
MKLVLKQLQSKTGGTGFRDRVAAMGAGPLRSREIKVLQVNLGYRCNMGCRHCHLSAGPGRTESMSRTTVQNVLAVLRENPVDTLDITGGAPELNPAFRDFVAGARSSGKKVIVRTNLTVFFESGMKDLPDFYKEQNVELIASLPCYLEENVAAVRGRGVFGKSLEALRTLNSLGFGREEQGLALNLVYNPGGPFLPPLQAALESDYKKELKTRYGIFFTRLYTFVNMPVGRFRDSLAQRGELEKYLSMLASAFNPAALDHIMCRSLLSVGWDGRLYDCDFNQALGMTADGIGSIADFNYQALSTRKIVVDDHCYGCTAGQGST